MKNKLDKAIKLLKTLEWSGYNFYNNEIGDTDLCPICDNGKNEGHTNDCELGLLIKE